MNSSSKQLIKTILFWGILFTAPVIFFTMLIFYLNSFITGDRVISVFEPLLGAVSEQIVSIKSAQFELSYKSKLELRDVTFSQAEVGEAKSTTASFSRAYGRFNTLSVLFGILHVDSLLIEDFSGRLRLGTGRSFDRLEWSNETGNQQISIEIGTSEMSEVRIKSFHIFGSHLQYIYEKENIDFIITDFDYTGSVDLVPVMNMLIMDTTLRGIFTESDADREGTSIELHGRIQFHFDDGTMYLRQGGVKIAGSVYPFTLIRDGDGDNTRWTIFFEDDRMTVEPVFVYFPSTVRSWLYGTGETPSASVEMVFHDEDS